MQRSFKEYQKNEKKKHLRKMKYLILIIISFVMFTTCKNHKKNMTIEGLKNNIEKKIKTLEGDFAFAFLNLSNPEEKIILNADEKFHAASTMKVPVMIEVFKQARSGKFNLSDSIVVKNKFKSIVDGSIYKLDLDEDSGENLYGKIGKKVTIEKLVYEMITVSSNLATNILIDLTDAKNVTSTMKKLGAENMIVLRGVQDIKAYEKGLSNSTTVKDLLIIMKSIATGKAGNKKDCERMIEILKDQKLNNMIPKYYPENITVAHKTGSITGVHHDAGIIYLPNGKAFILVILSKNLENFEKTTDALAKISKETLDFMLQ